MVWFGSRSIIVLPATEQLVTAALGTPHVSHMHKLVLLYRAPACRLCCFVLLLLRNDIRCRVHFVPEARNQDLLAHARTDRPGKTHHYLLLRSTK